MIWHKGIQSHLGSYRTFGTLPRNAEKKKKNYTFVEGEKIKLSKFHRNLEISLKMTQKLYSC